MTHPSDTALRAEASAAGWARLEPALRRLAWLGIVAHALLLPISIAGMQIALAVTLGALAALRAGGARVWTRSPMDLPALALACGAILSLGLGALAGSPPVGWHEATLWRAVFLPPVLVSAAAVAAPSDAPARRRLALAALGVWAVAVLLPSALAWIQHYRGLDPLFALGLRDRAVRADAPRYAGHYAAVGFFHWYPRFAQNLIPPLCLAGAIALHGGLPRRKRLLLGAAAAAAAAAVVLSLSRAAWMSLAFAGALLALHAGRRIARWALPSALVLAVAIAAANPGMRARLLHVAQQGENADRAAIWGVCGAVVKDHPLTGVGWGNLPRRSEPYYARLAPWFPLHAWCHDTFFSAWAEGGPVLFAALLVWWGGLATAFLRWRRRGDPLGRAAAAGALAALAAMLLNSLVHDILYASETMYALGFALGIAAVIADPLGSPPHPGPLPGGEGDGDSGRRGEA